MSKLMQQLSRPLGSAIHRRGILRLRCAARSPFGWAQSSQERTGGKGRDTARGMGGLGRRLWWLARSDV